MLKKVAVNKYEINRLIKLKLYKEARDYLMAVRETITRLALEKVEKYLENEIILESEKRHFLNIVENDINKKLLQYDNYVLMDENYINKVQENIIKLQSIKRRI